MLYLIIVLTSLFVINALLSGIFYYKYIKQKKQTDEILIKIKVIADAFVNLNETCEKTVAHSNNVISELARRVTQCEITVNQTTNAVKILNSGIRSQQSSINSF